MRDTVIVGGYEYRHADGQWGVRQVGAEVPFSPVTWPHTVAMIERICELEALAAATRVTITDAMVERAIRVGRDYGYFDWDESGEERVAGMRAVLTAALEVTDAPR